MMNNFHVKLLRIRNSFFFSDVIKSEDHKDKYTQIQAGYTAESKRNTNCGSCSYFNASDNTCKIVKGRILTRGWCRHWESEKIEKGRKALPVGHRTGDYVKQTDGEWKKVPKGRSTTKQAKEDLALKTLLSKKDDKGNLVEWAEKYTKYKPEQTEKEVKQRGKEEVKSDFGNYYEGIKNYFLGFNDYKDKLNSIIDKAQEHSVNRAEKLWTQVESGEITAEEYKKQTDIHSKRYHDLVTHLNDVIKNKTENIVKVLGGSTDEGKWNDRVGITYSSIYNVKESSKQKNNKSVKAGYWSAEKINHHLNMFSSILGDEDWIERYGVKAHVTRLIKRKAKHHNGVGDYKLDLTVKNTYQSVLDKYGVNRSYLVFMVKNSSRAYAKDMFGHSRITLGTHHSGDTFFHEMAHVVEDLYPDIHDKAIAFLKERTKGDKLQSLNKLTGTKCYGSEKAKPDKFLEPYMGKGYFFKDGQSHNTEIISMWFTQTFKNPKKFIQHDEEYFKTVLGWLYDLKNKNKVG